MKKKIKINNDNLLKKPIIFLKNWRPFPIYELISYVMMFACVPMLAYGIENYNTEIFRIIILTIITLYSGFFAALIWNDITDINIDVIAHPERPIPKGSISKIKFFFIALIFSALTFIFAIMISIWCLILVGATALFVTFHNKYLKKSIKIPAYSEIFTPVQWLTVAIFGFFAIWTSLPPIGENTFSIQLFGYISFNTYDFHNMIILVIFTYFADNAHDLPEGIHDVEGDYKAGVKTYATSFGERNAAMISFIMFFISGIFSVILFLRTILSPFFLILFLIIWINILRNSFKLIRSDDKDLKEMGIIVGRKGFDYLLMSYNLIFLDLLLQMINNYFNII